MQFDNGRMTTDQLTLQGRLHGSAYRGNWLDEIIEGAFDHRLRLTREGIYGPDASIHVKTQWGWMPKSLNP
jgi:hypothetical protein